MRRIISLLVVFCAVFSAFAVPRSANADSRVTWYYAEEPSSIKLDQMERNIRLALGTERAAIYGTAGGYYNLVIAPAGGLNVTVGPGATTGLGALYQPIVSDVTAVGGGPIGPGAQLPADSTPILGSAYVSSLSPAIGPLAVPSSNSQISLIECQVTTVDTTATSTQFVTQVGTQSASTVNRDRIDEASCTSKAGTAAASPTAPTVDTGYVGIGYVTIPAGTATITYGMITALPPIAAQISGSGANITAGSIPNSALATTPLVALSPGPNIVVGTGTRPSVSVTAAPSFSNLTLSGLTVGNCVQVGTGGTLTTSSGACGLGSGTITSVTGASNIVVTGPTTAPVVNVTNAPTFTGTVTAGQFAGSGAGLTAGTVPNAALATPPVTSLFAGSNIVVGIGTTPGVAVTAAPTFSGPVTASNFIGSGAGLTNASIPNSALVTTPLTSLTCSANVVCGSGTVPTVAVTAAPSFSNLTISGLTSGNCVQASTGGLLTTVSGACGTPGVSSLSASTNIVLAGSTSAPTVAVTNAPTFTGTVTANRFNGSGAGLSSVPLSGITPNTTVTTAPLANTDTVLAVHASGSTSIQEPVSQLGLAVQQGLGAYNVMAYGAKCDGTTDDSTAIQAANTAAAAANGTLTGPPGLTCAYGSATPITITNANEIVYWPGGTVKAIGSATTNGFVFSNGGAVASVNVLPNVSGFTNGADLEFNGNIQHVIVGELSNAKYGVLFNSQSNIAVLDNTLDVTFIAGCTYGVANLGDSTGNLEGNIVNANFLSGVQYGVAILGTPGTTSFIDAFQQFSVLSVDTTGASGSPTYGLYESPSLTAMGSSPSGQITFDAHNFLNGPSGFIPYYFPYIGNPSYINFVNGSVKADQFGNLLASGGVVTGGNGYNPSSIGLGSYFTNNINSGDGDVDIVNTYTTTAPSTTPLISFFALPSGASLSTAPVQEAYIDRAGNYTGPGGSVYGTNANVPGTLTAAGNSSFGGNVGVTGNISSNGTINAPTLSLNGGITWTTGSGAPTGSCTSGSMYTNNTASATNTTLYACRSSAWHATTGG